MEKVFSSSGLMEIKLANKLEVHKPFKYTPLDFSRIHLGKIQPNIEGRNVGTGRQAHNPIGIVIMHNLPSSLAVFGL